MHRKPYKSRTESTELQILGILLRRMDLSEKDLRYYSNLIKGHEGERMFDRLTEKLQCECIILNDLLLQVHNTTFQIDTLLILSDALYLYEVKNYDGDYFFESDRFYKKPKSEYSNPLHQLERNESLLRQLLYKLGSKMSIEGYVVFINPEFTLYQAPLNKPFIFPTQLNRYLNNLDSIPSKLTGKHKILADQLKAKHIIHSPYTQLPAYDFQQLKKGLICEKCSAFSVFVEGKEICCKKCYHNEAVSLAVLRNVQEFKLLFPNQRITTNIIHEWCNGIISRKRIRNILKKHLTIIGVHQWAYYE